jgi:glycosyltransferase involved in cell wall biosynthesis
VPMPEVIQQALDAPSRSRSEARRDRITGLRIRADRLRHRLHPAGAAELVREHAEGLEERRQLRVARAGRDVCWTEDDGNSTPLVTVRIATYNRGPLVAERAIASALNQSYTNLEVLVVGDACDAITAEAVMSVGDPRVRFVNLPRRGVYPTRPLDLWRVGGVHPMNTALALARGDWIAPCDDDDELTPTHVEELLEFAKTTRREMVYSKAMLAEANGQWRMTGQEPLREGGISHGSVLYSAGLRFFRHSETCWKLAEPADWNMWKRMRRAGVSIGFLDRVTYLHY